MEDFLRNARKGVPQVPMSLRENSVTIPARQGPGNTVPFCRIYFR
jgi:hypothetical protein